MTTGPVGCVPVNPFAEAGRTGGRSRSPKKLRAARQNAKRGGRPRGLLVEARIVAPVNLAFDRVTRDRLVAALLTITARACV